MLMAVPQERCVKREPSLRMWGCKKLNKNSFIDKLQFKVLAPVSSNIPPHFERPRVDSRMHAKLTFETQMVRGLALRECGPTETQLLPDGRHFQPVDAESWHVLLQDGQGTILGCARYRPISGNPSQMAANHSAIANSKCYRPVLQSAISGLISNVHERNKQYGEAGGWALRKEIRGSTAAVNIALMTFALAEQLGCGLAFTTATRMNHSASILCRIGASRVADLPAYYEPKYGSVMELLQFQLPNQNPRYRAKLDKFRSQILQTAVICSSQGSMTLPAVAPYNLPLPERWAA
jgi:hypothetical protein